VALTDHGASQWLNQPNVRNEWKRTSFLEMGSAGPQAQPRSDDVEKERKQSDFPESEEDRRFKAPERKKGVFALDH
jgi:hypothetical protein